MQNQLIISGEELVKKIDITGKNVIIIGYPASGKSTLCNKLQSDKHKVIATDDYKEYGFEQSMYEVLKDIQASELPTLIEGVQGYRLLRKGLELGVYFPDIVIEIKIAKKTLIERYTKHRDSSKIKKVLGFTKACDKILNDYLALDNPHKPDWIVVQND